jgi:hypothetical protein
LEKIGKRSRKKERKKEKEGRHLSFDLICLTKRNDQALFEKSGDIQTPPTPWAPFLQVCMRGKRRLKSLKCGVVVEDYQSLILKR